MSIALHNTVQSVYIIWSYFPNRTIRHICTIYGTYLDDWCSISGRWVLHILMSVTYLDDGGYKSGRVLHIWTVTNLHVTYYAQPMWDLELPQGTPYLAHEGELWLCFESGLGKYDRDISRMHCISRVMVSLQSGPVITRSSTCIWTSAPIMWTHPVQYQIRLSVEPV